MRKWILAMPRVEVAVLTAVGAGLWSWPGPGWPWVAISLAFLLCCIFPAMNCCVNLRHLFRMRFDPEYRRVDERLDALCDGLARMGDDVQLAYAVLAAELEK